MGKTRENGELAFSGLMTADTAASAVKVGTNIIFNATSGIVTATSFAGDGSNLTGVVTTDNVLDSMLFN